MSNDDDDDGSFPRWMRRWRRTPLTNWPFRGFVEETDEWIREFDRIFKEMTRDIEKNIPRELIREKKFSDGSIAREVGPFVYGYSVTVRPDGKPVIREFGNVKPKRGALEVKETREPLVDILDEEDVVKVVLEIPGVEKDDIKIECTESNLSFSVNAPDRKYSKMVDLPSPVQTESTKASYKNGVLEVTLVKVKLSKPKSRPIRVE